jgi:K+-transporting ATPase ATPase A chain
MIDDHHGRTAGRATLLARAMDEIFGTHNASMANNNGSAFAGLAANTTWYDTTLGLVMLAGRFAPIVLALAIAGSLAGARVHARTEPPSTPPGRHLSCS